MARLAVLVLVETVTETELLPEREPLLDKTDNHDEVLTRLQGITLADVFVNTTACDPGENGPPGNPKAEKPLVVRSANGSKICMVNWRL